LTQNISMRSVNGTRAVIDLGAHARLVAAVGGRSALSSTGRLRTSDKLLERRIDRGERLLLAAVLVAQDVARAHCVVLQVVALRELRDARIRQQLAHPLDVQIDLEVSGTPSAKPRRTASLIGRSRRAFR
jgi:hypothetical protein